MAKLVKKKFVFPDRLFLGHHLSGLVCAVRILSSVSDTGLRVNCTNRPVSVRKTKEIIIFLVVVDKKYKPRVINGTRRVSNSYRRNFSLIK